jgi:hypothetical protein
MYSTLVEKVLKNSPLKFLKGMGFHVKSPKNKAKNSSNREDMLLPEQVNAGIKGVMLRSEWESILKKTLGINVIPTIRLYESTNLNVDEQPFKEYFDTLKLAFDPYGYEVWARSTDFGKTIAAGIRSTTIVVIIYFKYRSDIINDPLNASVIDKALHHLQSDPVDDLELNIPER